MVLTYRTFQALFLAIAVFFAWSFPARAAEKTIGVVMTGNIPYYLEVHKAFVETMQKEGLFQKGKIDIVVQSPAPDPMAWTNAVRKLTSYGVDVVVSYGTPTTLLVAKETSTIPVVFAVVYDPQAAGISGKNITGITSRVPVSSLIKSLKDISNFLSLGVVYSSDEKDTIIQTNDIKGLEAKYGFKSVLLNADKKGEGLKISGLDALFLTTSCSAMTCIENYIGLAKNAKIPTASIIGGAEERGVIVTISADPYEQGNVAAGKVIEVLKGAKPSSLPVEDPKKINMIINLREATQLDLKIPFGLLTTATKVIK
jgi:putative ABC transport system substrate-binding protein